MTTISDLKAKIKRALGDGYVTVEVTDAQLGDTINQALDEYNRAIGRMFYYTLGVSNLTTKYDLSSVVTETGLTNVVQVQSISPSVQLNVYNGFYEGTGLPFSQINDIGISFAQYREQVQNIEQLFDSVIDFVYDRLNKNLYLKAPVSIPQVVLVCSGLCTVDQIPPEHNQMFFRGCLAYTKEMLGLIRRKYNGAELPGSTVNLDGASLVQEAKEGIDEYLKQLQQQTSDTIIIA